MNSLLEHLVSELSGGREPPGRANALLGLGQGQRVIALLELLASELSGERSLQGRGG